jgi:hypothetical protein
VSVSQADVAVIAPEFASPAISASDFAAVLGDVLLEISPTIWGSQQMADRATKYLVAHSLAMAHPELSVPGPVQSERVGEVSRTFAVGAPLDPDSYDMTRYGKEFKRLRRMMGFSVQVL